MLFNVHDGIKVYPIYCKQNLTVGELKIKIHEQSGIRVCRQALKGWKESKKREAQSNSTILRQLGLGKVNELYVTDMTKEGYLSTTNGLGAAVREEILSYAPNTSANGQLDSTYTLSITLKPSGEIKVLKFPGRHTVIGVKTDVYTVTDISVRHQRWTGWPSTITNATTLADSGIALEHNFTLESSKEHRNADTSGANMNTK